MPANQVTLTFGGDASSLSKAFDKVGSDAKQMASTMDAQSSKVRSFGGALEKTGNAADASESKFMGVSDIASGLGDLFGIEALGPIAGTGLALADLTGGFAQLAPVMSGMTDKIKNLSIVTKAQTIAQGALNVIMSLNPVFLVVAAIVALVAIFVIAYKKSETFRDIVNGAFNAVKDVVMGVFNWVKDNWPLLLSILTGPIGVAVLLVVKHWDTIKEAFTTVKDWIVEKIGDIVRFFTELPGRLATAAGDLFKFVKDKITDAVLWVGQKELEILDFFKELPGRLAAAAGDIFKFVKDKITDAVLWIGQKELEVLGWFRDLPGKLATAAGDVFGFVKTKINDAKTWVSDRIGDIVTYFVEFPGNLARGAGEIFQFVKTKMTDAKNWVSERLGDIVGYFVELPGRFSRGVGNIFGFIKDSFIGAINFVIRKWNDLSFTIGGQEVFGKHLPSVTIDTPNLREIGLAAGGIVTRPTLAMIGEAGPEAVIPLSRMVAAGGTTVVHNHYMTNNVEVRALDAVSASEAVINAVKEYERRNGTDWRVA